MENIKASVQMCIQRTKIQIKLMMMLFVGIITLQLATSQHIERIVGGHDVNITKHPHQISLRHRKCPECPYKHICGGSIYTDRIVITAAHCVYETPPPEFCIMAGSNQINGSDDSVIIKVKDIIINDDYISLSYNNDVALIYLEESIPLNGVTINSIPLATHVPQAGEYATVTGWGHTKSNGKLSIILQEVQLPIVDHTICSDAYEYFSVMDSMICAGVWNEGGKDSCQGDSGGPLVVNGELAGIVSWGRGCAEPKYPGVYSNIYYYKEWIEINSQKLNSI